MKTRKKKIKETPAQRKRREQLEFLYGKENALNPMYMAVHSTHHEVVAHCEYCGQALTRSDVNDYGSLCETCYEREYYGD